MAYKTQLDLALSYLMVIFIILSFYTLVSDFLFVIQCDKLISALGTLFILQIPIHHYGLKSDTHYTEAIPT